jgi:hypothetical protein
VAKALDSLFQQNKPLSLQTDHGKEFYNSQVKRVLDKHKVKLFSVNSPFKASLAERVNRTLKSRLWRYFTHTNSYKWHDVLQQFVDSYNSTPHSSLPKLSSSTHSMTPMDAATKENHQQVWQFQEKRAVNVRETKKQFKVGDFVRLSRWKGVFEKGFTSNFTDEIYRIYAVDDRQKPTMYIVKDNRDRIMNAKFYAQELQLVEPSLQESPTRPAVEAPPKVVQEQPMRSRPSRSAKQAANTKLYRQR